MPLPVHLFYARARGLLLGVGIIKPAEDLLPSHLAKVMSSRFLNRSGAATSGNVPIMFHHCFFQEQSRLNTLRWLAMRRRFSSNIRDGGSTILAKKFGRCSVIPCS